MAGKKGDPPNQGLLDESTRIPPSASLIKDTLKEIGAPDHERTAKLLVDNGLSFTPVEKPKRKSRSTQKASVFPTTATLHQEKPTTISSPSGVSRSWLGRYLRDCAYAIAVHCGKYLFLAFVLSMVAGTSFLAFIQLDLYEKIEKLRSFQVPVENEVRPVPKATTSPIETGSIPPPAPPVTGPWITETTPSGPSKR